MMGIVIALLAAAFVALTIITLAKLFDFIEKKLKVDPGTSVTGSMRDLLEDIIESKLEDKQVHSLESLKKKLKDKAMYVGNLDENGKVFNLEILNSEQRASDVEDLLEENDGMLVLTV